MTSPSLPPSLYVSLCLSLSYFFLLLPSIPLLAQNSLYQLQETLGGEGFWLQIPGPHWEGGCCWAELGLLVPAIQASSCTSDKNRQHERGEG